MVIEEGTIFRKGNIVFKETNMIDTRLNHHPLLIPLDIGFDDDFIYFFTLSSQIQYYIRDEDRYFLLQKQRGNGLKKTSIVDLKYVYKCARISPIPEGIVNPQQLSEMLEKFKAYPGVNFDEDCNELLGLIN